MNVVSIVLSIIVNLLPLTVKLFNNSLSKHVLKNSLNASYFALFPSEMPTVLHGIEFKICLAPSPVDGCLSNLLRFDNIITSISGINNFNKMLMYAPIILPPIITILNGFVISFLTFNANVLLAKSTALVTLVLIVTVPPVCFV